MKSTGIVRRIDSLGRVVIPVELRRMLGIENHDGVEMYLEGDSIVIAKYEAACCFCGGMEGLERFRGKYVCRGCGEALGRDPSTLGSKRFPRAGEQPSSQYPCVHLGKESLLS